jgi:putative intracellular protease/amidase
MQRGLEDRRIALFADGGASVVARALEASGARVATLNEGSATRDEDWHGGRYAALVVVDGQGVSGNEPRLVQLMREFLVSDKPVAVFGGGVQVLHEAGGVEEDALIADPNGDVGQFATRVVAELTGRLEEAQLDDMSDQSFPASDPPSTTPAAAGEPHEPRPNTPAR